ncbi:MAG: sigma-70 family RNA polymerase sigma factor [Chloroflexi bacterium]|nr:MAG: sigma-70 family RNA polymerase sigma factor [Chloroflexota bacterium]
MQADQALAALRAQAPDDSDVDGLARAARGGDLDAFEALVRQYQRRVYALAYQHLRDTDEAQDLAQEVFVRLYRNLDRYDPERPFQPWFWRLAANVAATYRRHRPAAALELPDVASAAGAGSEDALPLERALADLSDDLRLPVLLHYYLDQPLDEIALAMGLSLSAVKSRLHRARALLRRLLVEED